MTTTHTTASTHACDGPACRVCTGCARGVHGACRATVFCAIAGVSRACACCGDRTRIGGRS